MRAFLSAVCLLALLLGLTLVYTLHAVAAVDRVAEAADALPSAYEAECAASAASLEALWRSARGLIGLSVDHRTIEEIDRLVTSLQVMGEMSSGRPTSAEGTDDTVAFSTVEAAVDFAVNRALLRDLLQELRQLLLGTPSTVF